MNSLLQKEGGEGDRAADRRFRDLSAEQRFFARETVPAGAYKDVAETRTISVNAQWLTSSRQPDELVYKIVKALFDDDSRKLLDAGHAKGKLIIAKGAIEGLGIPLHPGAERFYREAGVLK